MNTETQRIIRLYDKNTGEVVDEALARARHHGTNYQAIIEWPSIMTVVRYGDSIDAAIQAAFVDFCLAPKAAKYDVRLAGA